jgi:hypothetical protein
MVNMSAGGMGGGAAMGAGGMGGGAAMGAGGMGGGAAMGAGGAGGLADMMGAGGMNMPLNSVGGALQVLDFMMNAMPSRNKGNAGGGMMVPNGGGMAGAPASGGQPVQLTQQKKPVPVVGGVGSTMNKSVNRGINRGINQGVNRSLSRSMRYIRF